MRRTRHQGLRRIAAKWYWREGDARAVLAAWEDSEERLTSFCRRLEIERSRLLRWRRRLGRDAKPSFHPVRLVESVAQVAAKPTPPIEVTLGDGRSVIVREGFSEQSLRQVLDVLEVTRRC